MAVPYPRDLLVFCKACGIENLHPDYHPRNFLVCNQCRDPLIEPNLNDTHKEAMCEQCSMSVLLLKDTPFEEGKSACRCGSMELKLRPQSTIADDASKAGAFDFAEDDNAAAGNGYSWIRSDETERVDSDYNQLFDKDLGAE